MKVWFMSSSGRGCRLALRIRDVLEGEYCRLFCKTRAEHDGSEQIAVSHEEWGGLAFEEADAVVFIGAAGIAVRSIAPHVRSKTKDPAVVAVDDGGNFVIPLLSGHIGGGNRLADRIAKGIGAVPVITTATDIHGKFQADTFASMKDMHIGSMSVAKFVSAALLDGKPVGLSSDFRIRGAVPEGLVRKDEGEIGIRFTYRKGDGPFRETLDLIPKCVVAGIGCRRGAAESTILAALKDALDEASVSKHALRCISSIDLKGDEEGLLRAAASLGLPARFFTASELDSLPDVGYAGSSFVRSVTGVDSVCERSAVAASADGRLILRKRSRDGVTVALALDDYRVDMEGGG